LRITVTEKYSIFSWGVIRGKKNKMMKKRNMTEKRRNRKRNRKLKERVKFTKKAKNKSLKLFWTIEVSRKGKIYSFSGKLEREEV
jgi:hypothetical protein